MITLKTSEFWTREPAGQIFEKIKYETSMVKFGPFNVFDSKLKEFRTPWIGEVDARKKKFKLFRVTGGRHTSDISVHGEYITRLNKPLVLVKYKVHFTAFFGLLGLLVCTYALWFLLRKKGVIESEVLLMAVLMLIGAGYAISIVRDLNKNEKAIERAIYKVLRVDDEEEDDEDEDEDEDIAPLKE